MDELAEATLHERYDDVFRFVRRQTASDAEAEEITQSVFAQAAARLEAEKDEPLPRSRGYTRSPAAPDRRGTVEEAARRRPCRSTRMTPTSGSLRMDAR